jgi:hypothetical protein
MPGTPVLISSQDRTKRLEEQFGKMGPYWAAITTASKLAETADTTKSSIHEEELVLPPIRHTGELIMEQEQVIEPHTFIKEANIVETVPVVKEIEVKEPHKVMKDIQVTELVPVKKLVEVSEPEVVMKEVQDIESRLVTKEIQVLEDVPVKRRIEVIEMVPVTKEVDTYELRTITKEIEVIEYVPVKRQVRVDELVNVKQDLEYVESIISTMTTTKKIVEPVIVDQQMITTIGPASLVNVETEMVGRAFVNKHSEITIAEQQTASGAEELLMAERTIEKQQVLEDYIGDLQG